MGDFLLGSLLGLVVPVIHMMGKGVGVGGNIAKSSGAFFFVWTLIALGVGGDYYDFLALPDGMLGIALGDVSGKGIAAALMMASLQASLRAEAPRA